MRSSLLDFTRGRQVAETVTMMFGTALKPMLMLMTALAIMVRASSDMRLGFRDSFQLIRTGPRPAAGWTGSWRRCSDGKFLATPSSKYRYTSFGCGAKPMTLLRLGSAVTDKVEPEYQHARWPSS